MRRETTLSTKPIAGRINLGTSKRANIRLHAAMSQSVPAQIGVTGQGVRPIFSLALEGEGYSRELFIVENYLSKITLIYPADLPISTGSNQKGTIEDHGISIFRDAGLHFQGLLPRLRGKGRFPVHY